LDVKSYKVIDRELGITTSLTALVMVLSIFGDTELINNITSSAICINSVVNNVKSRWRNSESRVAITAVSSGRPIRIRAGTKSTGTFRLASITNYDLEETGSVMVRSSSKITISNGISSFIIVNVTTVIIDNFTVNIIIIIMLSKVKYIPHVNINVVLQ
jgi:hypothetical protein